MKQKNNISNFHWNYAPEHSGLFQQRSMKESRYVRIGSYWNSIYGILNEFGKPICAHLFALAKDILSLSHRKVVPERGFSINKYLVCIHGNSINEEIVALRLVKDFICSEGGFSTVIITTELLQSSICEIITFKVSNVFGSPKKDK